jgi:hypothetical protein
LKSLLVGSRKGLFRIQVQGARATVQAPTFPGVPVIAVLHDPRDGAIYAALDHGHFGAKLHRSRDGGKTFTEIKTPTYPPKPEGLEDVDPMRKTPVPWSVVKIWSLAASNADDPGGLWCGTIPGGLFRSDDGGESWRIVESLWMHEDRRRWFGGGYDNPGVHSICVDPRNSDVVTIAVSCGGVWTTRDRGATWKVIGAGQRASYMPPELAGDPITQDPHRIVACATRPDRVWMQHHCGIFRSDDGGVNFTEITADAPSRFGFAVAVAPNAPDTAWFVPAEADERRIPLGGRLCVLRTTDAGKSFDVLSRGLPEPPAYDLVYRHPLDADATGGLAFGSTTGSLWTSSDGGDTFHLATAHLPPIATVTIES